MPINSLTKGTKEEIKVEIIDNDYVITDLFSSTPTFKVLDEANAVKQGPAATATAADLIITCVVDTTLAGGWAEGEYRLFVTFTVGGNAISKGPFFFNVVE